MCLDCESQLLQMLLCLAKCGLSGAACGVISTEYVNCSGVIS